MVAAETPRAVMPKPDPQGIRAFLAHFMARGEVYEARVTDTRRGPLRLYGKASGYFDDVEPAVEALARITGRDAQNVYMTLNPVRADLHARACNEIKDRVSETTADADIVRRRHLLIDTDPVRPAGVSATDHEMRPARERCSDIRQYLAQECGWPEPLAETMSGNGGGLLYCIDLPNDEAATDLVRRVLAALDALFSDGRVSVDAGNFNAARLTKVIGTVAAKGDHYVGHAGRADRPWRVATATYADNPGVVTVEQLTAVALHAPEDEAQRQSGHDAGGAPGQRTWTVQELLRSNGITFTERSFSGGKKFLVDCLTSDDHSDGAALFEMHNGALAYRCHHNRCRDKRWADARSRLTIPSSAHGNGRSDPAGYGTTANAQNSVDAEHPAGDPAGQSGSTKARAGTADAASDSEAQPAWPALDEGALHGLPGAIVRAIEPHTEADRAVLLGNVLTYFGNAGGREAYAVAEGRRHGININVTVVGETSKGRKGSSRSRVEQIFELADGAWINGHIASGLSSGEGLIYAVRDPGDRRDKEGELADPGVGDKRLLVVEEEFCTILKRMAGENNTLSATIRQAWDTGNLRILNKNSPTKATGAHISIIGHATRPELKRDLTDTEAANGFGNRFLWLCSRRSKCLPEGGGTPQWGDLDRRLGEALAFARTRVQPVVRNDQARAIWAEVYPLLSEGQPGLVGALTSRAEAQVLRLSVIYAVMDKSPVVRPEHLMAALAFWDYAEQSARYIFGNASGNPVADRILSALRDVGNAGMTLTEISGLFARHTKAGQRQAALEELESAGLAAHKTVETDGRPSVVYYAL